MNISKIGLVAIMASVCSSAGAATLDVTVTSDVASQFTYSAIVSRNDAVSIDQLQFAFNSPDAATSISNVLTPFGWTSAIESAADSGWRYSAADDPVSGNYGLSAGSFEMPAAVLSFRYDVVGQAAARQNLDAANEVLSGGFRDLNNARELQVVRQAAILNAQSALDQAQSVLTAAERDVTTEEQLIRRAEQDRDDIVIRLERTLNERIFERDSATGVAYFSAVAAVARAEAELESYKTQSAQEIADLEAALVPAKQEAARLENVVTSKAADRDLAVEALEAARLSEQQAVSDIAQARIQQAVAQDVSTQFALASLTYQSDSIANAAAKESVRQTALAVDDAERFVSNAENQRVMLEAALAVQQASLNAAQADLATAEAQPDVVAAKLAFDATVRIWRQDYTNLLRDRERQAEAAYRNDPTISKLIDWNLAREAYANRAEGFLNTGRYLEAVAAYEASRAPIIPLEAAAAEKTAEYELAVAALAAAVIAQSDAIEELADLRLLAAAARAELALYPDDAGRELSGFSYTSAFGPISGPALLTGMSANQTVGVLVAGEAVMPAVPLPASTLLLLTGLAGFGALRRRQGKRVVS